ncbi:unnamed protein product [Pleuronectes platessa]|uniref:Uncharacterized protein n=1 Tax=Pleuronectes platessa TaxID=8262 RepID=A0A9N7VPU9_PLEPL|nr:unnamed protein product [Pleuronectes platessa]
MELGAVNKAVLLPSCEEPVTSQHRLLLKLQGDQTQRDSEILVVRDTEGGRVYKQMLPTDLRKHGVGARCSDNLATLGPADVAMTEMGLLAKGSSAVAGKLCEQRTMNISPQAIPRCLIQETL